MFFTALYPARDRKLGVCPMGNEGTDNSLIALATLCHLHQWESFCLYRCQLLAAVLMWKQGFKTPVGQPVWGEREYAFSWLFFSRCLLFLVSHSRGTLCLFISVCLCACVVVLPQFKTWKSGSFIVFFVYWRIVMILWNTVSSLLVK